MSDGKESLDGLMIGERQSALGKCIAHALVKRRVRNTQDFKL